MSFRLKTVLGIAVIEVVLLALLVFTSIRYLSTSTEEQLIDRARTTVQLIATMTSDAVIALDLATLDVLVQQTQNNPDIEYVRVVAENGSVLSAAGKPAALKSDFKADNSVKDSQSDGRLDVSHPIATAGNTLGRVEMGLNTALLNADIRDARNWLLTVALIEVILVAIFGYMLGRILTRQLSQLQKGAAKLAQGDLGFQVPITGRDELAQTATSFNQMSANLARYAGELTGAVDRAHRQEVRMRATIDTALDGVIAVDCNSKIIEFNPAAEAIFGYRYEEVYDQSLASVIMPPEHHAAHDAGMRRYLETGTSSILGQRIEVPARRSDGQEILIELAISCVGEGDERLFIAYLRDITDRKAKERELIEAKERAEEASKAKSAFLAMMSHEIRTPINGVLGTLSLMEDTGLNGRQRELVETGKNSGNMLLHTINDILDFSKMEAGKLEFEEVNFSLPAMCESVVEIVRPLINADAINLVLDINPGVPHHFRGDQDRLRQVLLNLLNNASKFTEAGEICVNVALAGREVGRTTLSFEVQDTGCGIPEEAQKFLFDDFTTVTPTHSRRSRGTGLGLAICKQLVEMMDGEIGCDSVVGEGSTFWFDVTLEDTSEEEVQRQTERTDNLPRHRMPHGPVRMASECRLLLAEDNPTNALIATSMLDAAGYPSTVATNGLEALQAIRRRDFDLVLMDIGMPEMDGIEATREIRTLGTKSAEVPIVAMTAHVLAEERERIMEAGLDDYLAKPFDREALLQLVEQWTNSQRCPQAPTPNREPPIKASPPVSQVPPSDATSQPVFRATVANKLAADTGADMVPSLVASFVTHSAERCDAIEHAIAKSDIQLVGSQAHALKSSAASFGAMELNRISRDLEQAATSGDDQQVHELAQTIRQARDEAIEALERWAEGRSGADASSR